VQDLSSVQMIMWK